MAAQDGSHPDGDQGETVRGARMPRSQRRRQLLAAAQEIFVANGYHAAAMDDIAERAGVSKPVLYQHFPSKLELYLALVDATADTLSQAVHHALSSTDDNRARIRGVLSAYFAFVAGGDGGAMTTGGGAFGERLDSSGSGGAFRLLFETDLGNEPAVRERVEAVTATTMQAVAAVVANDTGLDTYRAELLATALTGAANVAARWWLDSERPLPQDEAVALLESLLWRGISDFPRQFAPDHGPAGRSGR